jgi:hypothetical protein
MNIDDIYQKIDSWIAEEIGDYKPPKVRDFKVIRDPIHDFIRLAPHETSILDCPIMQRLRRIHQTALAYMIYPGMHHTRFEHSIGVLHVSELMLCALEDKSGTDITPQVKAEVRLAALLHDVGHAFLSHLGETLLKEKYGEIFKDLANEKIDETDYLLQDIGIGEILSYLIVTSPTFSDYFKQALTINPGRPEQKLGLIEPKEVARLIIGKVKDERYQFKANIVHGGMDADKIDYFMRDCHYSGIRAEVDASRLINTLKILNYQDWPRTLTVSGTALHHLEQILTTKLILFSSVYHHHKVRVTEAAVRNIYRKLCSRGGGLKNKSLEFSDFTAFLQLDDAKFLTWAAQEDGVEPLVKKLQNRDLLKRCLVICRQSIRLDTRDKFIKFALPSETPTRGVVEIEQEIFDSIPNNKNYDRDLLVVDFPPLPDADKEAAQIFIQGNPTLPPEALKDLLPTDDWLHTYAANKYRAHVFYDADEDKRRVVANAAESVLQKHGIIITPWAKSLANL